MRILSLKQVCEKTSLSRASIYRKVEEGTFPSFFALGERKLSKPNKKTGKPQLTGRIGWMDEPVDKWIADRAAKRIL